MKAVILGKGASISQYDWEDWQEAFVIAPNDGYFLNKGVQAIASTDSYTRLVKQRPLTFRTPEQIPHYITENQRGTFPQGFKGEVLKTKRYNFQKHWNPYQCFWHGCMTPFFCASIAIHKGARELYFFGIDLDNSAPNTQCHVAKELNGLAEQLPVYLASSSFLWKQSDAGRLRDSEKKITTLNVNRYEKIASA